MKEIKNFGIIGDIHGRNNWKLFVENAEIDHWIFLGDYVDSYDISNIEMIHNLKEIIEFKKNNFDKVTLLLANHDISYLYHSEFRCSGFRPEIYDDIYSLFYKNQDLFEVLFIYEKHLFTHAGITNRWLKFYKTLIEKEFKKIKKRFRLEGRFSIFDKIKWLQHTELGRSIIFASCGYRMNPPNPFQIGGLVWVDKISSSVIPLAGYNQYVGHTPINDIQTIKIDAKTSITYIDVLGSHNKFFTLSV